MNINSIYRGEDGTYMAEEHWPESERHTKRIINCTMNEINSHIIQLKEALSTANTAKQEYLKIKKPPMICPAAISCLIIDCPHKELHSFRITCNIPCRRSHVKCTTTITCRDSI